MGGETRWPLRQAAALARSLVTFLEPYCDRIEVAGSVRRQKADVGDIELVLVPKLEQRPVPGQLGLLGLPVFVFQEGGDRTASRLFPQIAKLTRGAYCKFDRSSPDQLKRLLGAVAAYAAGGRRVGKRLVSYRVRDAEAYGVGDKVLYAG